MKHPAISELTDYVRRLAAADRTEVLESHLADGCEPCRASVAALRRVAETPEVDAGAEPLASATRSVKAIFALESRDTRANWSEIDLSRAFDSLLTPAMASRSVSTGARQMLFESEEYTLELSIDASPARTDRVLRGQLLETHGGPRSHAPVFLVGGGEVIDRSISRQHGTFEISGPLDPGSELWVFPDGDSRIRLPLAADR